MYLAHFFVETEECLVLFVLCLYFSIGWLVFFVVERFVALLNEVDGVGHCIFFVELLAVELIGLNSTGDKALELGVLEVLHHFFLNLFPLALGFCHLFGSSAILAGVEEKVVELSCRLNAERLRKLRNHVVGVSACHRFGDFAVRYFDAHLFDFLVEEAFLNHLLHHLLLYQCCVHLLTLVLKLLAGKFITVLELDCIDFFAVYFGDSVVVAKH